jgi:CelD/BcsL family acetyltransferase involved in cellulose biosynthesis
MRDLYLEHSIGAVAGGRAEPFESRDDGDPSMRITVTSDLASIENEWRGTERDADCTPFQTFDWLSTWQACIGSPSGVRPAVVVGKRDDGEVAFILPLAIERTSFLRRLVFLGRELCDYNAPILAPEFSLSATPDAWWRAVYAEVRRTPGCEHDVVFLDKMPEAIGSQLNPLCALKTSPNASHAYAADLGNDWDAFYASKRSAHARRGDRRKRRLLEGAGDVRFTTAKNAEDIGQTLDILFSQKGRWFARMGIPNLFAKPGFAAFFLTIAAKAPELVHVSRLDVRSECVATNLGLVFHKSYYSVLLSHDDGQFYRHSPGTHHHHDLMRYAIDRGCCTFDFTIGDEPFKRDWADTVRDLHDYLAAASPLGYMSASVTSARLKAKRTIKQSPHLWALATRTRSALSAFKQDRAMSAGKNDGAVSSTADGVSTEAPRRR